MAQILVIDDDEIMNEMITQLLSESGYEPVSAREGKEAMALFDAHQIGLIITDIIMPGKEGIETIISFRAQNKTIPIIAISGGGKLNPDYYLSLAKRVGANCVFQKPFSNEELLSAVDRFLPRP